MPNREKLPLFITKLVSAKRDSGAIRIEFNAGSEEVYTRFLSRSYAQELALAILQILSEDDDTPGPPIDNLDLAEEGDTIRFKLMRGDKAIISGRVTKGVGAAAYEWLGRLFDGPNVVRMKKRKHPRAHG